MRRHVSLALGALMLGWLAVPAMAADPGYGYYPGYNYYAPGYNYYAPGYNPYPQGYGAYPYYPYPPSPGAQQTKQAAKPAKPEVHKANYAPARPQAVKQAVGQDHPVAHGPDFGYAPAADVCCDPQDCCQAPHFWASAEYLIWWIEDGPLEAALVTAGSETDDFPGAIGQPGTTILFGGQDLDYGTFSGGRVTVGGWVDCASSIGVEGSGFVLEQRSVVYANASDADGVPLLARPFINSITGNQDRAEFSYPFEVVGRIDISASTQFLGADVSGVANLCRKCSCNVDVLIGFRYADLDEDLVIGERFAGINGFFVPFNGAGVFEPNSVEVIDSFRTRNQFLGAQIGAKAEFRRHMFVASVIGKVALGSSHQVVNIDGSTALFEGTAVNPSQVVPGGVLALQTNMGERTRDAFAVIPEVQGRLGVQLTPSLAAFVGYSFVYWSKVVRPGDQIDLTVNPTIVPSFFDFGFFPTTGPQAPVAKFKSTDFWAQGLSFGLELRY